MLKFFIFLIIGWFILKILRGLNIFRRNKVTMPEKDKKNKLNYNKGDIEDADFKDLE